MAEHAKGSTRPLLTGPQSAPVHTLGRAPIRVTCRRVARGPAHPRRFLEAHTSDTVPSVYVSVLA